MVYINNLLLTFLVLTCFEALMKSVKAELEQQTKRVINSDHSNFLWIVRFFTGYHFLSQKMDIFKKAGVSTELLNSI